MRSDRTTKSLILKAFLWLPVCFAFWYVTAPWLTLPVVWFSQLGLKIFFPGLLEETIGSGKSLELAMAIFLRVPQAPPDTLAQVVVSVNILIYSWNMPVLLALLLAIDKRRFPAGRLFAGYAALLPFQAWGVTFEVLKKLALQSGPEVANHLNLGVLGREFVALGYQFGYLILPIISASAIWIILSRTQLNELLSEGPNQKPSS